MIMKHKVSMFDRRWFFIRISSFESVLKRITGRSLVKLPIKIVYNKCDKMLVVKFCRFVIGHKRYLFCRAFEEHVLHRLIVVECFEDDVYCGCNCRTRPVYSNLVVNQRIRVCGQINCWTRATQILLRDFGSLNEQEECAVVVVVVVVFGLLFSRMKSSWSSYPSQFWCDSHETRFNLLITRLAALTIFCTTFHLVYISRA